MGQKTIANKFHYEQLNPSQKRAGKCFSYFSHDESDWTPNNNNKKEPQREDQKMITIIEELNLANSSGAPISKKVFQNESIDYSCKKYSERWKKIPLSGKQRSIRKNVIISLILWFYFRNQIYQ